MTASPLRSPSTAISSVLWLWLPANPRRKRCHLSLLPESILIPGSRCARSFPTSTCLLTPSRLARFPTWFLVGLLFTANIKSVLLIVGHSSIPLIPPHRRHQDLIDPIAQRIGIHRILKQFPKHFLSLYISDRTRDAAAIAAAETSSSSSTPPPEGEPAPETAVPHGLTMRLVMRMPPIPDPALDVLPAVLAGEAEPRNSAEAAFIEALRGQQALLRDFLAMVDAVAEIKHTRDTCAQVTRNRSATDLLCIRLNRLRCTQRDRRRGCLQGTAATTPGGSAEAQGRARAPRTRRDHEASSGGTASARGQVRKARAQTRWPASEGGHWLSMFRFFYVLILKTSERLCQKQTPRRISPLLESKTMNSLAVTDNFV